MRLKYKWMIPTIRALLSPRRAVEAVSQMEGKREGDADKT
jgi:hypothetical protein